MQACEGRTYNAESDLVTGQENIQTDEERRLPWTTTDLYMHWAAEERLSGENAVECDGCRRRTEHVVQRRVMTAPNVFIVQCACTAECKT